MDAILTDSHLDTRTERCITMNVILIVPKLVYAGAVYEGIVKIVKRLETEQVTAAKIIPRGSSTTSNTVLRAELEMYPLETNRDTRKLKWLYKVRRMPKKRFPAIVDRAEGSKRASWNRVGYRPRENMERDRRKSRRDNVRR